MTDTPALFTPLTIRDVTLRNRVIIAPMCQYSATDGVVDDWHVAHYSSFALGGAAMVISEATSVSPEGRISHGDTGIWTDEQARAWQPITAFLERHNTVPAMQLAHAGRKASTQRPWEGYGPLDEASFAKGEHAWKVVAPSAEPAGEGWLTPVAMDRAEIDRVVGAFADGAKRALEAGFRVLEIHGAHGYLIQSFLSPLSNHREDAYGGDLNGRMRFALDVAEAVRAAWPEDLPLFFRISSVDGFEGGWEMKDSVVLAGELKARGVDVVDCSSGGNSSASSTISTTHRGLGFQVPYASQIREETGVMTQAVGLITTAQQAEQILQDGDADLIAIGREALNDPFWPRHAAQTLGVDSNFEDWPDQYGWWLTRRARTLRKLAGAE